MPLLLSVVSVLLLSHFLSLASLSPTALLTTAFLTTAFLSTAFLTTAFLARYGRAQWRDGSSYAGDWQQDRKHGFGVFRAANGTQFVGMFRGGVRHGLGVCWTVNGEEVMWWCGVVVWCDVA